MNCGSTNRYKRRRIHIQRCGCITRLLECEMEWSKKSREQTGASRRSLTREIGKKSTGRVIVRRGNDDWGQSYFSVALLVIRKEKNHDNNHDHDNRQLPDLSHTHDLLCKNYNQDQLHDHHKHTTQSARMEKKSLHEYTPNGKKHHFYTWSWLQGTQLYIS